MSASPQILYLLRVKGSSPSTSGGKGSRFESCRKGIVSGRLMGIQLLWDIALGDEERSRYYYSEFSKQSGSG